MNHSLKSQCSVSPGTVIKGKWHGKQYTILRELGFGANGIVYLAKQGNVQVALKMSDNGMSITSEVNVLKSFAKVQGSALGPSLLDVDDWENNKGRISFYSMEYIEGPDLMAYIQQKGKVWTMVLILQLLKDLQLLHDKGWVFGDLKPENLIVTGPPAKIRCIDVGGTTLQGRAIKEFTEFFDRGYWGLGTRKADPSYDLFAVGMILINTAYPNRFNKTSGGVIQLRDAIRKKQELLPLETIILKALQGHYISAGTMREDLLLAISGNDGQRIGTSPEIHRTNSNPARTGPTSNKAKDKPHQKAAQPSTRQSYQKKKKRKKGGWSETIIIFMCMAILYGLYIFIKLL
ncbi:protein kinase family protein [Neobacillus sp. PS3-34]|uniref:protein kinase domain-containing protein n=1 Tax=Neobacillus sp. PS3-34 TaxID=3070678 RepID=UPI0027E11FEE|nr:protein kinase family protein [Neobacillus sp. PS3-34]WML50592.1 protein kinase family protein [Neobacillus sp. PS3-34]